MFIFQVDVGKRAGARPLEAEAAALPLLSPLACAYAARPSGAALSGTSGASTPGRAVPAVSMSFAATAGVLLAITAAPPSRSVQP